MASDEPGRFLAEERLAVRSPRAAAIAGVLFAILFSVSVIHPPTFRDRSRRRTARCGSRTAGWFDFAIVLMPFAGIVFLWFIAVVRVVLGRFEDQFFATVMLGAGLIFLAMVFVATGVAGGILVELRRNPVAFGQTSPTTSPATSSRRSSHLCRAHGRGVRHVARHLVAADEGRCPAG